MPTGIDRFLDQVGQAAEKVGPLAEKLETLATNVDEVVRSVDRAAGRPHRRERRQFHPVSRREPAGHQQDPAQRRQPRRAVLTRPAPKLDSALGDISNIAKAIDPAKVGRTVDKVEERR